MATVTWAIDRVEVADSKQTIYFQEIVDGVKTKQYSARIHVNDPISDALKQIKTQVLADRAQISDELAKKAAIDVSTFETFINTK